MLREEGDDIVITEIRSKEEGEGKDGGSRLIIMIYNKIGWGEIKYNINRITETRYTENIIIGGDFNIRTGNLGGIKEEEGDKERNSKDKYVSKDERILIEWMQEKGWYILNGTCRGDWNGEYTYVGARGDTVIDYVFANEQAYNKVKDFRIGNRVDSDHLPLQLELEEEEERRNSSINEEKEEDGKGSNEDKWYISWTDEDRKRYREDTEVELREEKEKGEKR